MTKRSSLWDSQKVVGLDPSSRITGYAVMAGVNDIREAGYLSARPVTAAPEDRIDEMVRHVRDLLKAVQPERVVIEMPSGKVHIGRHQGGGAGLSVYGWACGAIWQAVRDHFWPMKGVSGPDELTWTNGVPKRKRQAAIAAMFPRYAEQMARDSGGDVSDAIGLCLWWYEEQAVRKGLIDV